MQKSLHNISEYSQFALRSLNKQTNPIIIALLPGGPDQDREASLLQHCQQEGAIFKAIFIGWTLNMGWYITSLIWHKIEMVWVNIQGKRLHFYGQRPQVIIICFSAG